jgi:four helix bundle protein
MVHGKFWNNYVVFCASRDFAVLECATGTIFLLVLRMSFKFEKLNVWHKALDLSVEISSLASRFPSFELYNLGNQIRRASDSVVLNIAEGCTSQSNPEFAKFVRYSLRSAIEVVSCLFIAKKKSYISQDIFIKYYREYEHVCRMLSKLNQSLKQP